MRSKNKRAYVRAIKKYREMQRVINGLANARDGVKNDKDGLSPSSLAMDLRALLQEK